MSETFVPNWAVPPGSSIKDFADGRGVSLDDLASALGLTRRELDELLDGTRAVTPSIASSLSVSVGGSKRFWLQREAQYRTDLARLEAG